MKTKLLSYIWTYLAGFALLAALLWTLSSDEPSSDVLFLLSVLCFFASFMASLVIAITRKSRESFYRVVINVTFCLLFFPTRTLGGYLEERLFLMRLPRFQEATDLLIRDERAKHNDPFSSVVLSLPAGYSDLNVTGVHVDCDATSVTVRYFARRSIALWHGGYLYQSDDNPANIKKESLRAGYRRVSPRWFFWAE